MDMTRALGNLGCSAGLLDPGQRQQLDEQGYLILPGLIDGTWLSELREHLEELYRREGGSAGVEVHQEGGTRRLSDLVNKGAVFDRLYTHPLVLAAIHQVIGRDFKLSSLNARDALPGAGLQGLHADWGRGYDGRFHVCNSIWLFDDMDEENGCTRLVPGSQYQPRLLKDIPGADPTAPHPDEIKLIAPAGTVCVFNSHVWHGGTLNRSKDRSRRACHCYYTAREHTQQLDQRRHLRLETWKRLSPAARYILDVDVDLAAIAADLPAAQSALA